MRSLCPPGFASPSAVWATTVAHIPRWRGPSWPEPHPGSRFLDQHLFFVKRDPAHQHARPEEHEVGVKHVPLGKAGNLFHFAAIVQSLNRWPVIGFPARRAQQMRGQVQPAMKPGRTIVRQKIMQIQVRRKVVPIAVLLERAIVDVHPGANAHAVPEGG